jgi:hypothetical protein
LLNFCYWVNKSMINCNQKFKELTYKYLKNRNQGNRAGRKSKFASFSQDLGCKFPLFQAEKQQKWVETKKNLNSAQPCREISI